MCQILKVIHPDLYFIIVELMKQQDQLRIEIVGEESYAPPTLHQDEGIE